MNKVLNEEAFAILVLMALATTFLTTPAVISIYQPDHTTTGHRCLQSASACELRILACVHSPANIPSLVNLSESTRSADKSSRLKVYVMHLVELTERSSSIIMVRCFTQKGFPLINSLHRSGTHLADRAAAAFQAYSSLGRVTIRPATAVSALATMHEDICHVAEEKAVAMIVLPFHKQWVEIDGDDVMETVGHRWSGVTQRVLKEAPCTVAVMVDRGYGAAATNSTAVQNVCVLFFGGTDDVEALELGGRMAEHPAVKVTVISFINAVTGKITAPQFKENDEVAVAKLLHRMEVIEKTSIKIVDEVIEIGRDGGYDLIIVGKGTPCSSTIAAGEHPELGPIGNVLASSYQGVTASVLVVQRPISEELSLSKRPVGGHDQKLNLA